MNYSYSNENRIVSPCTYMYTPYEGISLLESYSSNRGIFLNKGREIIRNTVEIDAMIKEILNCGINEYLQIAKKEGDEKVSDGLSGIIKDHAWLADNFLLQKGNSGLSRKKEILESFSPDRKVETMSLLISLFSNILSNLKHSPLVKMWMDRLVQRFEVTKKLYERYKPGFRKGEGKSERLILYALFAMILSIYYYKNKNLKYLNALLKINDTLISVIVKLADVYPAIFMAYLSASCEDCFVGKLVKSKGIMDATI
ncbi:hypothetical protein ISS37_03855 [candidate division KSB1 bacterium]|nr:hypothetical protein [candidate division KSB1 bacterium]